MFFALRSWYTPPCFSGPEIMEMQDASHIAYISETASVADAKNKMEQQKDVKI